MPEIHSRNWSMHLMELVRGVNSSLFIASPFITRWPLEQVARVLNAQSRLLHTHILTNLFNGSDGTGSLNVDALVEFSEHVGPTTVSHLPSLHAKVYIADNHAAIISSANLTTRGLRENLEYGVLLRDEETVKRIRKDFEDFALLGCSVPRAIFGNFSRTIERWKTQPAGKQGPN